MKTSINTLKSLLMGLALVATTSMSLTSCMDDLDEGLYANDFAAENIVIDDIDTTLLNFYKNWRNYTDLDYRITAGKNANINNTGSPWIKKNSTNNRIPRELLDDLVEDPAWEVVYSGFENMSATGLPYIIFYNELTGIARVLYFSEKNADGNQMLFAVVAGNKNAAWNHAMNYGVPTCATQTAKCINPYSSNSLCDTFTTLVRPYNQGDNDLGDNLPFEKGWYAFDLDMSSYSKDDFPSFRIFGISENTSTINLFSDLQLSSTGSINKTEHHAATSSAFGNFTSFKGIVKGVTHIANSYVKPVMKLVSSQGTDLGSYLSIGKSAIADITTKEKQAYTDTTLWGNISMTTTGTITTSGTIQEKKSSNVPQLEVNKDVVNPFCHFGQGIWNISEKPVIYISDVMLSSKEDNYFQYFLDPTSIKVEINSSILKKAKNIHVASYVCTYPTAELGYSDAYSSAIYGNVSRLDCTYNRLKFNSIKSESEEKYRLSCLGENGSKFYKPADIVSGEIKSNLIFNGTLTQDSVMIAPRIGFTSWTTPTPHIYGDMPDLVVVVNLTFDYTDANGNQHTCLYTKRFLPEYKKVSFNTYHDKAQSLLEKVYFEDYSVSLSDGKRLEYVLPELTLGHIAKELGIDVLVSAKKKARRQ